MNKRTENNKDLNQVAKSIVDRVTQTQKNFPNQNSSNPKPKN